MMRRTRRSEVAQLAVTETELAVRRHLRWLFREQPTEDYGIDAHVEVVDHEEVTGKLLAVQIKGGMSWFDEPTTGGWWFRPDADHVDYWTHHSLPVVIVMHNPDTGLCYWQLANDKTLEKSSKGGWRLLVPKAHVLDTSAKDALRAAADGDSYELRLRELRLAKPWMEMLAEGTRLVVDFEEWIHKTSGRGTVSIGIDHEDGEDPEPLVSWFFLVGPTSYSEAVPKLFAWADADVHAETYDFYESAEWESQCVIWDERDKIVTESYSDWAEVRAQIGIRPYANAAGEVDYFRIELTLNELGRAFLIVDNFAMHGTRQLTG